MLAILSTPSLGITRPSAIRFPRLLLDFQLPLSGSLVEGEKYEDVAAKYNLSVALSTPSLGITMGGFFFSLALSHPTFNSLSRDHGALTGSGSYVSLYSFQLPLSGSLKASPVSFLTAMIGLSTPSLGITYI